MLNMIIATALFVVLSALFWKSKSPPKDTPPRRRRVGAQGPGAWEASDNQRRGAR